MATETQVRVLGFDELASGSATLAKHIAEAAPDAFRGAAADVASRVSGAVPKLTGALAGSVTADVSGQAAIVGYGDVPYAPFVEFGGRGHPYSPEGNYLYPTAQDAVPIVMEAAEKVAASEIGAMHWPSPS